MNKMKLLYHINLPRLICDHTMGKQHTAKHRLAMGLVVMFGGVLLSKGIHSDLQAINVTVEVLGAAIHGVGLTPFIELGAEAAGFQLYVPQGSLEWPLIDLTLLDKGGRNEIPC